VVDDIAEPDAELDAGLERTRGGFMSRLKTLLGGSQISPETWADVEETLIAGDVGAELASDVVGRARARRDAPSAEAAVRAELTAVLESPAGAAAVGGQDSGVARPHVILAAADTFRAAAIDQLRIWATRTGSEVVAHVPGADPAAVVYDALDAAIARGTDTVIADTAGRLHTKANLMDELSKIRRIIDRRIPGSRPETLFVLDATTGQNGLAQALAFHEAVGLTGIVLTKLDSTARGGIVFSIARRLAIPVRYVGVGERANDPLAYEPEAFDPALFEAGART
jgi:fused signal recognition particle receptor